MVIQPLLLLLSGYRWASFANVKPPPIEVFPPFFHFLSPLCRVCGPAHRVRLDSFRVDLDFRACLAPGAKLQAWLGACGLVCVPDWYGPSTVAVQSGSIKS